MNDKYDAIIIGGGHNGLTCAIKLAKKGLKVFVAEKKDVLGGIAAPSEFHSGYSTNGLVHDTSTVRKHVLNDLNISYSDRRPDVVILAKDGRSVTLSGDSGLTSNSINEVSSKDALAYVEYKKFITDIRPFIRGLLDEIPPNLVGFGTGDLWQLMKKALGLKKLGNKTMMELLKVAPMSVADFLNERFETDFLKAGMAGPAIYHSFNGPWASYTTLNLLLWECTSTLKIEGGPSTLINQLEAVARKLNIEIETGCYVQEILINEDRKAHAVQLSGSRVVHAPLIVSSATPEVTFYDLIKPNQIEYNLEYGIQHYRSRGTTVKVNLALNKEIALNGETQVEYARTGNSFDEMEKAFDAVKYGELCNEPIMDIHFPSISDKSLAPEGHTVVSIMAHFAPYNLKGGWTDQKKTELEANVLQTLDHYSPGVADKLVASEILSPEDIEREYSLTGGHIYHGEHAIDQLLTRPIPSCMQYSTPIEGLYLCGSGSHPGGGLTCMPGALAAEAIMKR